MRFLLRILKFQEFNAFPATVNPFFLGAAKCIHYYCTNILTSCCCLKAQNLSSDMLQIASGSEGR